MTADEMRSARQALLAEIAEVMSASTDVAAVASRIEVIKERRDGSD